MLRRPAWALLLCLLPSLAHAGSRELEAGLENFWYRTAETPLNRDDILGLQPTEDLLRASVSWKETHGPVRAQFKGFAERAFGSDPRTTWTTRQAWAQYSWEGASVRVGKQRIAWGSGFAWNPTNRLEPPKNPANTSLEQEGSLAVRLDVVPATWAGIIFVASRSDPAAKDLPFPTGSGERNSGAVRARFLAKDTDLAVVVSGGERQPTLVGLDLGRSVRGVTLHAESAFYEGSELAPARPEERFFRLAAGGLWTRDTTSLTAEYFYNGEGYDDAGAAAYLAGLDAAYSAATDPALPESAREAALSRYLVGASVPFASGLGLRRHYLQASWSRSEIHGQWTASVRGVVGLSDGGVAVTPGLTWAPRGNLTLSVDAVVLLGPDASEYRLAPLRGAVQARLKALF